MKKIIITSIVLSAAIVATSGNKIAKQTETKTPPTVTINSIHTGNELASAD